MERVVAEKGLRAASMEAIAAEAAMSKRTLYAIYENRDALFEAWVRRVRATVVRPLTPEERALPLTERLRRLLNSEAHGADAARRLMMLRAVIAEAPTSPELARAFLRAGPHAARAIVTEELERAIAAGEIRPLDSARAAHLLLDMVYAAKLERLVDPETAPPTETEAKERLNLALSVFLEGARRRESG